MPLPLEDASDDSNTQAKSRKRPAAKKRPPAEKRYDGKTAEEWFDVFWNIIPKRMDNRNVRARSLVHFTKYLKAGVPPAEIIAGAQRERDKLGARHEYAYAPQNWLRDKMWEGNRTDAARPYTEAEIAG